MKNNLIKCHSVNYRKGYLEVVGEIHSGCVNLESWNIDPDCDMSGSSSDDEAILEDAVVSHTELELSVENAEQLIQCLKSAIDVVNSSEAKRFSDTDTEQG